MKYLAILLIVMVAVLSVFDYYCWSNIRQSVKYIKQSRHDTLPEGWRLQYNGSGKWKAKQPDNVTCFCDKSSGDVMVFNTKEEAINGAYDCIKLSRKISNDYTWYDYKK